MGQDFQRCLQGRQLHEANHRQQGACTGTSTFASPENPVPHQPRICSPGVDRGARRMSPASKTQLMLTQKQRFSSRKVGLGKLKVSGRTRASAPTV